MPPRYALLLRPDGTKLCKQVQALPLEIDCLTARLSLTYDAKTDEYSTLGGISTVAVRSSGLLHGLL